jgi:hypothetical protein
MIKGGDQGMHAPTVSELLSDATVLQALDIAWADSMPYDPVLRHEEGGWVYMDLTTGQLLVRRAPAGTRGSIDLNHPPIIQDAEVVAKFHTHPNPTVEGWDPGPSAADRANAVRHGVPSLIRADNGIHSTGPASRRGGLGNGPGYPP